MASEIRRERNAGRVLDSSDRQPLSLEETTSHGLRKSLVFWVGCFSSDVWPLLSRDLAASLLKLSPTCSAASLGPAQALSEGAVDRAHRPMALLHRLQVAARPDQGG